MSTAGKIRRFDSRTDTPASDEVLTLKVEAEPGFNSAHVIKGLHAV